jgi:hypothetical protein
MTVMIPSFFGMPHSLVRQGKLKELTGMAIKLYAVLWHDSERYRTRRVKRTVTQLRKLTGGSRNALTAARRQLAEVGLVAVQSCGGDGFIFDLCDPETGRPWPGDPSTRIPYERKKPDNNQSSRIVAVGLAVPAAATAGNAASARPIEDPETEFAFGANFSPAPGSSPPVRWDDTDR